MLIFGIAMIFYYLQFLPIFMESVGIAHWFCCGLAETAEIVLDICLVKLKPMENRAG
jgi:hypothetical protein